MTAYNKFKGLNIETMPLGIEQGDFKNLYFCTPKGAKVIGWAGVDGIHFCFIRGFGEMIFAVSPMNTCGDYVHPLANSFSDFLRLLLACGNTAALEQAHGWNQNQFDTFLADNRITEEQISVLSIIAEKMRLEPMEYPFEHIKQLQAGFDYSRIKFTEDYEDFVPSVPKLPKWKVYFDGNFWGHSGRERAGKEIPINIQFALNDEKWLIPSVYSCSKGLVIDFCVQIPIESIRDFVSKWKLSAENDGSNFTNGQQMQIEAENPMAINISSEIILGGKTLSSTHGCGLSWNPCFPEQGSIEAEGVLKQYGLDPDCGWTIWRSAFPWQTIRKPKISSLSVTIKHDPVSICGARFSLLTAGEYTHFIHPTTNVQHTLTMHEYERQEISEELFGDKDYEYPAHCAVMSYTIYPDIHDDSFSIRDCGEGDRPRKRQNNPNEPQSSADCFAIAVIGGADGVTVITLGGSEQGRTRAACSALHFSPEDTVEWQIIFSEKPCADMTVKII